jgi:hypothetical protein
VLKKQVDDLSFILEAESDENRKKQERIEQLIISQGKAIDKLCKAVNGK